MSGEDHSTRDPAVGDDTSRTRNTSQSRTVAAWQQICAAAIASLAGWGMLQVWAINETFDIPEDLKIPMPNTEQAAAITAALRVAEYENSALVMGLLGALIGGTLAVTSVVRSRSVVKGVVGFLSGIVCGGVFGAAGGMLGIVLGEQLSGGWPVEAILPAMAMHSIFWTLTGCGVGLAVGLPTRSGVFIGQAALAGLGAGLIAGLLFVPVASYLFPVAKSELPFPGGEWNRLLWIALPTFLIAIAVSRAARTARRVR